MQRNAETGKTMTPVQKRVMGRLRAGEWLISHISGTATRAAQKYLLSGGGDITERTHGALERAGLIRVTEHPWYGTDKWERWMKHRVWVAADLQEASK